MFWTENFLNKIRNEWLRRIVKVQYQANNIWYDGIITEKKIVGNTIQILSTTSDSLALTVTAVRLLDTSGEVAGQISENITKLATQGIITLWETSLYEVTVEVRSQVTS